MQPFNGFPTFTIALHNVSGVSSLVQYYSICIYNHTYFRFYHFRSTHRFTVIKLPHPLIFARDIFVRDVPSHGTTYEGWSIEASKNRGWILASVISNGWGITKAR